MQFLNRQGEGWRLLDTRLSKGKTLFGGGLAVCPPQDAGRVWSVLKYPPHLLLPSTASNLLVFCNAQTFPFFQKIFEMSCHKGIAGSVSICALK